MLSNDDAKKAVYLYRLKKEADDVLYLIEQSVEKAAKSELVTLNVRISGCEVLTLYIEHRTSFEILKAVRLHWEETREQTTKELKDLGFE